MSRNQVETTQTAMDAVEAHALAKSALKLDNLVLFQKVLLQNHAVLCGEGDLGSLLLTAAKYGRLNAVKFLLDSTDVSPRHDGSYALQLASSQGHIDVVKFLGPLSNHASDAHLALRWGIIGGNDEVIDYLITLIEEEPIQPALNDTRPLVLAIVNGHIHAAVRLLRLTSPDVVDETIRNITLPLPIHHEILQNLIKSQKENNDGSDF